MKMIMSLRGNAGISVNQLVVTEAEGSGHGGLGEADS